MSKLFTNNATTTLAAGITAGATSLSVTAGTGSLFPTVAAGNSFQFTLVKNGNPSVFEICTCTSRSGDLFSVIVRAQEGTTALSWNAGDTVALLFTAVDAQAFMQSADLQAQAPNYAIDTGPANAYAVSLTPPLAAHVIGMPIRFKAGHNNTTSSTFTDGVGALALQTQEGAALVAGDIVANEIYEVFYNGSTFIVNGLHHYAFSQITGTVSNAQVPSSAVTQYAATLFASPTLTGTPVAPTAALGTTSTQIATTAFVNQASSLSPNGYIKLASGFVLQWGYAQANGTSPGVVAISFPISFPTAWLAGGCSTKRSTAGSAGSNFICQTPAPTTTGMSCVFDALDGLVNTTNGGYWWAFGH